MCSSNLYSSQPKSWAQNPFSDSSVNDRCGHMCSSYTLIVDNNESEAVRVKVIVATFWHSVNHCLIDITFGHGLPIAGSTIEWWYHSGQNSEKSFEFTILLLAHSVWSGDDATPLPKTYKRHYYSQSDIWNQIEIEVILRGIISPPFCNSMMLSEL